MTTQSRAVRLLWCLVGLLVARLVLLRRIPLTPLEAFLLVVYLANAALSAIFFTRIRSRLPFDVLLICALAPFLDRLWLKFAARGGGGKTRRVAQSRTEKVSA